MKPQPDKIFHAKLFNHSSPVPSDAWDRVGNQLDRKKPRALWWAAAATVAIAASAYLLYQNSAGVDSPEAPIAVQNEAPVQRIEDTIPDTKDKAVSIADVPLENQKNDAPIQHDVVKRNITATVAPNPAEKHVVSAPAVAHTEEIAIEESIPRAPRDSSSLAFTSPSQLAYRGAEEESRVTIILSAEETNEYLTISKTDDATSSEKKSSTLRKLLRKAADLKTNQDPFGELRQKKDEILALNFRSDKQRGQKK